MLPRTLLLVVALAATLGACGSAEDPAGAPPSGSSAEGSSPRAAPEAPPAELLGDRPHDSAELGALHGEIRVTGDVPERFPIGARQRTECKAHPEVEHMSDVVLAQDGKLQNAYLRVIHGLDGVEVPPPPSAPVELDQRGCIYTPHVLAMRAGQALHVLNSDPTTHNVHVKAPRNAASLNRSQVAGQGPIVIEAKRAETMDFKCDIHPWMSAVVHVSEHPWYAISDEAGAFSIPGLPPGDYVVEVVHERFGKTRGRVSVQAGTSTGFALTLSAD